LWYAYLSFDLGLVGLILALQSLMNFILPSHFADAMDSLRAIFKVKGDTKVSLLAQERVSRAKKMMTPFVLRRRKDQVSAVLMC
jgi:SWI/SNF-related matrix-associated actin-dependent regulator 1 of chromatin subfamily A